MYGINLYKLEKEHFSFQDISLAYERIVFYKTEGCAK